MSLLRILSRLAAVAAATSLLAAASALAAEQDSVAAVWVPRHIQFIYHGFTARYSCDGLRDEIQLMLAKLGAKDIKVRATPCSVPPGVPSPFPGVSVQMRVLVPADSKGAAAQKNGGAPVQARWHEAVLMRGSAPLGEQGNCELIAQFKKNFLPLFATRNIKFAASCVPHEVTLGAHLSAEVLVQYRKSAHSSS